jgi:SAM-dependent methyltransferase
MTPSWISPLDGAELREVDGVLVTASGDQRYERGEGDAWDLLPPDRREALGEWAAAYGAVRAAEGRASLDDDYYRSLPWVDTTGWFGDQWATRAASFSALVSLAEEWGEPGLVADLGAGNCWAAARLVDVGWSAVALDLNTDSADGLGARHHHGVAVEAARATLDVVPLADSSVDLALLNASLHYAHNPHRVLREALRIVRPGGRVVVLDSPVFRRAGHGDRMVREQEAYLTRMGVPVPPTPGRGFLLADDIDRWAATVGGTWEDHTPRRGLLRSVVGRYRAGREIARLSRLVGTREAS